MSTCTQCQGHCVVSDALGSYTCDRCGGSGYEPQAAHNAAVAQPGLTDEFILLQLAEQHYSDFRASDGIWEFDKAALLKFARALLANGE